MKKLIIFDMDGTILDTLRDLADCTNYILRRNGYPEHPPDAYRYFVGNGIPKLIERAIPEKERQPEIIDKIYREFVPYYELHKEDFTKPYPGIPELMRQLQDLHIHMAIASNKIQQAMGPLVERYFAGIRFSAVLGNRPGIPPKPDPAIVEEILTSTAIRKEDTLYVGDTAVDMQTAENAGLTKIGVLWGFRNREELEKANADFIVEKPEEILHYIH